MQYRTVWEVLSLWGELLFGSSTVGEAGLFPGTVTNTASALLLHSQKSSLEERARVLVCPCATPHQVLYLLRVFSSDRVTNRGFKGKC